MKTLGTPQRVTVLSAGKEYRASCNDCGWQSYVIRASLGAARKDCRAHAKDCKGVPS